ncbi:hypothetical protein SLH49_11235 [Cognatiyoonia sp. IB215446]|uniref:hypothetical protein n=1 Tax=Cognatiyoonia sp. IB215446 TaxID=3097355 RepID=UPI002A0C7965|nr:hypothetical protein [Cognatiyoonia sp. IB215446]MDX8348561.1 hypothetical protein [Cognatiyoonia sp. IB215446]
MDKLIEVISSLGVWGTLFAVVLGISLWLLNDIWSNTMSCNKVIDTLEKDTPALIYIALVRYLLDKVTQGTRRRVELILGVSGRNLVPSYPWDMRNKIAIRRGLLKPNEQWNRIFFSDDDVSWSSRRDFENRFQRAAGKSASMHYLSMSRQSWSIGVLDLSLLISLGYSVLVFVAQWAVTGEEISLSGKTILSVEQSVFVRAASLLSLLASFVLAYWATTDERQRGTSVKGGFARLTLLALSFSAISIFTLLSSGTSAFSFTLVAIFAVGFVVNALAGCIIAVSTVFVGVFASAVAGYAEFGGPIAVLAAYIVVGTVVVLVLMGLLSNVFRHTPLQVLTIPLSLIFLLVVFLVEPAGALLSLQDYDLLILFLLLLPIVNGFADFASTGCTRYCLGKAVKGDVFRPWWVFVDVAAGFICFILLTCVFILIVHASDTYTNHQLVELDKLLGDATVQGSILNSPNDYWWLYIAFGSTLVPTFLHLILWVCSIPIITPKLLRTYQVKLLKSGLSGNSVSGKGAILLLSLQAAAAVTLTCYVSYKAVSLISVYHPEFLVGLVDVFRMFYLALQ